MTSTTASPRPGRDDPLAELERLANAPPFLRQDLLDDDAPPPARRGWLARTLVFGVLLPLVGVVSALAWRGHIAVPFADALPSAPAFDANAAAVPDPGTEQLIRDIEGLRKTIEAMSETQRQMAQSLAALAAAQDALRRQTGLSPAHSHWITDPGPLGARAAMERSAAAARAAKAARPAHESPARPTRITPRGTKAASDAR